MKKNITTIILTAIVGFVIAYFITNLIYPSIDGFSFKTLSSSTNFSLTNPSDDIFNYRSINPTVEVYVGECTSYNPDGSCADETVNPEDENENNENNENNNQNSDNPDNANSGEE